MQKRATIYALEAGYRLVAAAREMRASITPIPSQDGKTESEGLASAPVTEHEQARFPSQGALAADPVGSPPPAAGSADQFNDTGPHVFSDQEPVA